METKELKDQLDKIETELKNYITKAEAEVKAAGSMSVETKAAVEKLAKDAGGIMSRLLAVEQKLTAPKGNDTHQVKSLGEMFVESEQYKNMVTRGGQYFKSDPFTAPGYLHTKTALVNSEGLNQPLVPGYIQPGIITPANQPLTIRDVIPSLPMSSNLFEYVKETTFTNNAAIQGLSSSPQVYENVSKAESALAFTLYNAPVRTIAHFIPVSNQLLADAPLLQGYINTRLLYGLKKVEESEIVNGTDTAGHLSGLTKSGNYTAYDTTDDAVGDNRADTLRHAIKQARVNSFYSADAIVLNPADWEKIELTKETGTGISSGQYVFTNAGALRVPTLWGRPVVECDTLTAGTFMVGAFRQAAVILDREGATVQVSREHASFFIQNMTAILCEERVGFAVTVPAAIIYGTFAQTGSVITS